MDSDQRHHKTLLAVYLGLAANAVLAVVKTAVGVLGHSPALLADGINSTSDVVYYVVVRVFMGLAHRPADAEHPYGHRQLESIAALVVGAFVVTTAVAIFFDAMQTAYDLWTGATTSEGAAGLALAVALGTVAVKGLLAVYTKRIGRETMNPAVAALAYDHRNDIFAAAAASIGIFLGRQGHPAVDPLAGAVVAIVILRTGVAILRDSSDELMDTVPGTELASQIDEWLVGIEGVERVEEVHAHRFGPYLVINVMIGVDGDLTVVEGDRIATAVERTLEDRLEFVRRVHVHYHPVRRSD